MTLGQDFTQDAMDAFSGELYDAVLTTQAIEAIDVNNPTAAPTGTPVAHPCEGFAFDYEQRDIDGVRIVKGDYQVVILRGSLDVVPKPGDEISIPPPGATIAKAARVVNVVAITEAQITLQARGVTT